MMAEELNMNKETAGADSNRKFGNEKAFRKDGALNLDQRTFSSNFIWAPEKWSSVSPGAFL